VQELQECDLISSCTNLCREFLTRVDDDLVRNLFMSDGAHFYVSGFVSKQNFRYWANENPYQLRQKPLKSAKVTVWCAISFFGIIDPYFLEDNNEIATKIISARYIYMIQTFFAQELTQFPRVNDNTWFQQDGVTSHMARNSVNAINQLFRILIISRNGDISWPVRSPDLSACYCFLRSYLKSKVYTHRPQNIAEMKFRIREEISGVPMHMLRSVMGN